MKKIVFRNFRYLYCDDFALFLQEMSEKGWHFSRWGIGLEFEKGQPEKRIYHVEVFQNASELDLKAEYDTNEYGDYCEAAGWKFLDSRRKFCIFRKERMDAPDIVTAEERFSIIRRAELSWRLWEIAGLMLCFALNFWQVWTNNFVNSIFDNLALMVSAILIFFPAFRITACVWAYIRLSKNARQLKNGIPVYYGFRRQWCRQLAQHGYLFSVLLIGALFIGCLFKFHYKIVLCMVGYFVVIWLFDLGTAHFRPSREARFPLQFVFYFLAAISFSILLYFAEPETNLEPGKNNFVTEAETIFGKKYTYTLTEEIPEIHLVPPESMTVTIYESPYPWVLKKSMESASAIFRRLNCETDTTSCWNAVKAVSNVLGNCHVILYPDQVIDISSSRVIRKEDTTVLLNEIEKIHKEYIASTINKQKRIFPWQENSFKP